MNENRCRVTVTPSEIPRISRASATSSADRVVVPRSMTFERRYMAPAASGGSQIDPALIAMLIVTAGVVRVRFARTTMPLSSVDRAGTRLGCVTSSRVFDVAAAVEWQRIEPADRAVRFGEHLSRGVGDFLERHCGDARAEVREDVHACNCLEIANLVRDVRDAVVLEDQPRIQLRFGFREFTGRDSTARDGVQFVEQR